MKYFTKILSIILCVAEVSVLAQNAPMPSDKCQKAIEKFEHTSAGKTLEKCSSLLNKGKVEDLCSNSECFSVSMPSETKTDCKSGDDILFAEALEETLKAYGETMRQLCKNPPSVKPIGGSSGSNTGNGNSNGGSSGSTTGNGNSNSGSSTGNAGGNANSNTTGNAGGNANSGTTTTGNAGVNANGNGNANANANANGAAAGNTATTGNANGATTTTDNQTDPQLSQIPTISNGNSTTNNNNTLDMDSSAGSKFTYSVVAAAALAALNLLL